MRRDSRSRDAAAAAEAGASGGAAAARDMIGEIENRSSHLLAVSVQSIYSAMLMEIEKGKEG
jgi:hypothetical protein